MTNHLEHLAPDAEAVPTGADLPRVVEMLVLDEVSRRRGASVAGRRRTRTRTLRATP